MKLKHLIVPAIMFIALGASPTPAQAQRGHGGGGGQRGGTAHAVPRAGATRVAPHRPYGARPHVGRPYGYRSYGYHPYGYRPYGYRPYGYRPYPFHFRPRFSIGLGLWLGYPVPYPYYDAYAYPDAGPLEVVPGDVGYGGVSLDITPNQAAVTVDGTMAGTVDDFNDPSHPLSLPAGRHHMEVRAPGYVTLVFDVDVEAGQVLPYQGDLQHN